mgnify:CR=1 FL=1
MTSRSSCKRSTNLETPFGPRPKIISCNCFVQLVRSAVRKRIAERRTLKSISLKIQKMNNQFKIDLQKTNIN